MATKRKEHGDETMESPATEPAKAVYFVAEHGVKKPAYSVYKVDAAADAAGVAVDEPPLARALAHLTSAEHGMSFVAAHSWIVGVGGGLRGSTIFFDPSTSEVFDGPHLRCPKHEPVLIFHGGKLYALSRRPKVLEQPRDMDFEPWFEYLSFNKGLPTYRDSSDGFVSYWHKLPPPPCFPCRLTPLEFRNPPDVSVSSYAATGDHILISLQQEMSTYAFHVVEKKWEKVHDKNLPFVGHAVPLSDGLFAGCPRSKSNNPAAAVSVFHLSVKVSLAPVAVSAASASSTCSLLTSCLSVVEFPVAASKSIWIPGQLFCRIGKGSFCSIRLGSVSQNRKANGLKKAQVMLALCEMVNAGPILSICEMEKNTEAKGLQVAVQAQLREQNQAYKLRSRHRLLAWPVPVVALLSMDAESTKFEEKRTKKRACRATSGIIFEVPLFCKRR